MDFWKAVTTPKTLNLSSFVVVVFFIYLAIVSIQEYKKTRQKHSLLIFLGALFICIGNILTHYNAILYYKSHAITQQQAHSFQSIIILMRWIGILVVIPGLLFDWRQKRLKKKLEKKSK